MPRRLLTTCFVFAAFLGCYDLKQYPGATDAALDADATLDTAPDVALDVASERADATEDTSLCRSGQVRCGNACVDLQSDPANCGACGNGCPVPTNGTPSCVDGACAVACSASFHLCSGECLSDASSMSCGTRCDPCPTRPNAATTCADSACGFACNAGFADCNMDAADGCEATLGDAENCGACRTRCAEPSPLCRAMGAMSTCVSGCDVGTTRCAMSCVDTQTDVSHCGRCGNVCAAPAGGSARCDRGACAMACPAGQHVCGARCVSDDDVDTCGTRCDPCPTRPNATTTCAVGACAVTCNVGFAECDRNAANGCETSVQTDSANCGACGRVCVGGQVCVSGSCACPTGQTTCGSVCRDLAIDNSNCGACGRACTGGQVCLAGTCACAAGLSLCGGTCVNLLGTDNSNCGACGRACTGGQSCLAGTCTCPTGRTFCAGACVDTNTDLAHCGACGRACVTGQSCVAGGCVCPATETFCGGACVDTGSSTAHCGGCGRACGAGQSCVTGVCVCPAGQTLCGGACVTLATNSDHCGRCGGACASGVRCVDSACVDGLALAPEVASGLYVESVAATGGERTWAAFRAAAEAERVDGTLAVVSYAALDGGGERTFPVGRVAVRYVVPSSVRRVVRAAVELRASAGVWGDADMTDLVVVGFTPGDAMATMPATTDMALSRWGMSTPWGSRPNADFEDRVAHVVNITDTAALAALTPGASVWFGVVTGLDQRNRAPNESPAGFTGTTLAAPPRLVLTYMP